MSDGHRELDRRRFIAGGAASGLALGMGAGSDAEEVAEGVVQEAARARRPNVIVYIADQFRADFIGANGQNYTTKTPNLDAMAARGTNFGGAICNQPVCSPSRSVLMTGRYATETGVYEHRCVAADAGGRASQGGVLGEHDWEVAPGTGDRGGGRRPRVCEARVSWRISRPVGGSKRV